MTKPIAVFVHVHYPDIWSRISVRIEEVLRRPFHLILTTSVAHAELRLPETPYLVSHRIVKEVNRGRDIRPFLNALRDFDDYDIGLKLHTKRSVHRLDGADWGTMLVEALLPDPETIDRLVDQMETDARLALIVPDGMLVSMDVWMGHNRRPLRKVARRLGEDLQGALRRTPVFGAGSMFWFERKALAPFAATDLNDLFEPEKGQVDGTTAHAVERFFSLVSEAQGGIVTTMEGAAQARPSTDFAVLRSASRLLADRPNDFLAPLGKITRFLLKVPGLRRSYRSLPDGLRRSIRNLRER